MNEFYVWVEFFKKEVFDKEKNIFVLRVENEDLKDDVVFLKR